jgi:hypothetical protein
MKIYEDIVRVMTLKQLEAMAANSNCSDCYKFSVAVKEIARRRADDSRCPSCDSPYQNRRREIRRFHSCENLWHQRGRIRMAANGGALLADIPAMPAPRRHRSVWQILDAVFEGFAAAIRRG